MNVVITGASGQLARRTAELVLDTGAAQEVILVTRDPDALSELAARGATVRHGDFEERAGLPDAFAGADRMLLVSTDAVGSRVDPHRSAIEAAVGAGVRHIAYTSILNPSDSNPVALAAEHRATEEAIRASGAAWTFLRNGVYAETLVPGARAATATGRLVTNAGEGRTSYVSREDCAAAAAAVLTGEGHEGRAYDITGPEAVGPRELAAFYVLVGGNPVEPVFVDDEEWIASMVQNAGATEQAARGYATFGIAARRLYLAAVSTAVQELTGRPPMAVIDVLRAHEREVQTI